MAVHLKERAGLNGSAGGGLDLGPAPGGARTRRVPEVATGLLAVAVCALAGLWWQASISEKEPALALRNAIEQGDVLTLDDLQVVSIDSDTPLAVLSGTEASEVVGGTARTALPAGSLITSSQFTADSGLVAGGGVVGLDLELGEAPSASMAVGDVVAVVLTPSASDPRGFEDPDLEVVPLVSRATVVEVADVGGQGGTYVAIEVSESDASRVAAADSVDRVRLIRVGEESP